MHVLPHPRVVVREQSCYEDLVTLRYNLPSISRVRELALDLADAHM